MIPAQAAPTVVNPNAGPKLVSTFHFTMQKMPELHAATPSGSVTVKGGDGNRIVVTVTRRGNTGGRISAIVARAVQSGNEVDVSAQMPVGCKDCTASYEITVPRVTKIVAESDAGDIAVQDVAGTVDAATKFGKILCGGLSANVTLSSQDGLVNAGFSDVSHVTKVTLASANGGLRVVLPAGASIAHLKAGTGNGEITAPGFDLQVVKKGPGAGVDQTLSASGPDLVLGTANGPISIVKEP